MVFTLRGALDWMFVFSPTKFICRSPNPQHDGVWRWGLWEPLWMGSVPLQEETLKRWSLSLSLHCMRTQQEGGQVQVRKGTVTEKPRNHASSLISDLPAFRILHYYSKNKPLLFKPWYIPCGILLKQPKWYKRSAVTLSIFAKHQILQSINQHVFPPINPAIELLPGSSGLLVNKVNRVYCWEQVFSALLSWELCKSFSGRFSSGAIVNYFSFFYPHN